MQLDDEDFARVKKAWEVVAVILLNLLFLYAAVTAHNGA